jgi:hypothetical protein
MELSVTPADDPYDPTVFDYQNGLFRLQYVGPRNECASIIVVTAGALIGIIVFDKENVARQHRLLWLELAAR